MAPAQTLLDFDCDSLTFDHSLFFVQKYPKNTKSNPIFHLMGRGDRDLILIFLDSPMAEFFTSVFFFFNFPDLG